MKIKIGDEEHIVVYIDYNDGIPHTVYTIEYIKIATKPYWRLYEWNFFANNGMKDDIRAYNNGSGGSHKSLQAPTWVDGYTGKYWIHKDAKFKGKVKNGKKLKHPISLPAYYMHHSKTSRNPFNCAEITNNCEYCEICGHESTEFCDVHKYDDEKGNERYKHNNELV